MKKIISFFILSILVSCALFAVTPKNLKVELNLAAEPIEYFGISDKPLSADITHAAALALFSNDLKSIDITPTSEDLTKTAKGTFYVWWYIYSPNQFKMYINFSDLASGSTLIPYKITDDESNEYRSTDSTSTSYTLVKDLNSTVLIKGSKEMTVPAFDRLSLKVAEDYTSTVTIKIDTV